MSNGMYLFGFPVDGLGELLLGHRGQRDLLDDHGVTGERGSDVLGPELGVGEEAPHRVRHGAAVDDGAIDNAVGRNRLDTDGRHAVALPGGLELDGLYGAGPDVESHQGFASAKEQWSLPVPRSVLEKGKAGTSLAVSRKATNLAEQSRFIRSRSPNDQPQPLQNCRRLTNFAGASDRLIPSSRRAYRSGSSRCAGAALAWKS